MRIEIKPSARVYLVTDAEILAVTGFPSLRIWLAARHEGAQPILLVGPAEANQPSCSLGMDDLIDPEYGPQRA